MNSYTHIMKIYVSGKFDDKKIISDLINTIKDTTLHRITHDWTAKVNDSGSPSIDVEGVQNADLLLILITDDWYEYRSTSTELGIALGLGKQIILIDPFELSGFRTNMFTRHHNVQHVRTTDEALQILSLKNE